MRDHRMQWAKADGTTGVYEGQTVYLGRGIPRPMGDHGVRRALFDLAFGYVSGFPVRDILPFAARSLFPQRIVTLEAHDVQPVTCEVPPPGWWCSRPKGHDGPCAADEWPDDPRLTEAL